MGRAILAGRGSLPGLIYEAGPAEIVTFRAVEAEPIAGATPIHARFERLGEMFSALKARGVTELCLAGGMTRPHFDPAALDETTKALLPRLMAAMAQGDDGLLRSVIAILEEQGFQVRAAHELRPDLVSAEGALAGAPSAEQQRDAARGRAVLQALGAVDVGQSVVVASGQVIGIETLQGTDAMLRFVAETAPGSGGVLVKRPKPGQDLRVDLPAIGTDTIAAAVAAGLSGIEIAAGGVLLLGPDAVRDAACAAGLALWVAP